MCAKLPLICLENSDITLTPLMRGHAEELFHCVEKSNNDLFDYMFFGPFNSLSDIEEYVESQIANCENVYAIFSKRLNEIVGSVSLMNNDIIFKTTEIGNIWLSSSAQKTEITTSVVLLLLEYVFENCSYNRVVWKCDNLNVPSKMTAEKLGFEFEGLFRKHMIMKNRNRDTAWFSIIDDDWSDKKVHLSNRLNTKKMNTANDHLL